MAVIEKDILRLTYTALFTVRFLHSGYGPARQKFIADSITLEPDEKTKKLFINHNMGHRFFNDTLICFIRTSPAPLSPPQLEVRVPYIMFPGEMQIRFIINASTDFLNKTNVTATGAQQLYQFTNQVNIGTGGFISMHTDAIGVTNDDLRSADLVQADKTGFGVIDIFSTGAMTSSYEIFDPGTVQQLTSPVYLIPFTSTI